MFTFFDPSHQVYKQEELNIFSLNPPEYTFCFPLEMLTDPKTLHFEFSNSIWMFTDHQKRSKNKAKENITPAEGQNKAQIRLGL